MSEDRVLQALKALAESDREKEAPPEVEARLLREFNKHRSGRRLRWVVPAAFAAGVAIAVWAWPTPHSPQPPIVSVPQVIEAAQPAPAPVSVASAPVVRKVSRKLPAVPRSEPREVVTEFFPLMNPAPPFERGQMLRVQLPASAMQSVGLPVREEHWADPVQADVLVGEEGMPRAIRFVRFDVQ